MLPILSSLIPTIVEKGMDLFDKKFGTDSEKIQKKAEFEKHMQEQISGGKK